MTEKFDYSVKRHVRSKHIKIKVNSLGRVEVVAPPGIQSSEIHQFVQKNTLWICKTISQLRDTRLGNPDLGLLAPKKIVFLSIPQRYSVNYFPPVKKSCVIENSSTLFVYAQCEEERVKLLRDWIQTKAKQILVPWLREVSLLHKISFNKVSIRAQKTRWGSCSSKKNISLNRNLLFIDPELVSYLMIHELSHIIQMNHSKQFWSQVAKCEPNYKVLDKKLVTSQEVVPLWVNTPV